MTTPEEVQKVGVRSKWPNEERDFTPWLSKNLHILGNELGMKLELVQRGSAGWPVLSRHSRRKISTESVMKVAIENQLEETDHTHLGQLLTYAYRMRRGHRDMGSARVRVRACPGIGSAQQVDG